MLPFFNELCPLKDSKTSAYRLGNNCHILPNPDLVITERESHIIVTSEHWIEQLVPWVITHNQHPANPMPEAFLKSLGPVIRQKCPHGFRSSTN